MAGWAAPLSQLAPFSRSHLPLGIPLRGAMRRAYRSP